MKPRVDLLRPASVRHTDSNGYVCKPAILVIDGVQFESVPTGIATSTAINTAAERLVEEMRKI